MKKIVLVFLVILIFASLLAWLLLASNNPQTRELGKELGKIIGQAVFAALAGGIIVQEYNRQRERNAAINEFRKTVLRNFIRAYVGTKKSRRLLRARCRFSDGIDEGEKHLEISRKAAPLNHWRYVSSR